MSEDEARAFIESLAKPSTEKRVFYRWQVEKVKENLLKAGKMTPKMYEHFMDQRGRAGGGLYVSENIISSSEYGDTLIKVELEPGYKYLDLTDEKIKAKIKSKGLVPEIIYLLSPRVAIKYDKVNPHWVLKDQAGVNFKAFSPQGININHLNRVYLKTKKHFSLRESIKHEVSKRVKDLYGKTLSELELKNLLETKIKADSDLGIFLYINSADLKEKESILNKSISLMKTSEEGKNLLNHVKDLEQRELILNKVIPRIETAREGSNLLLYTINTKERELIFNKSLSLIRSARDAESLLYRVKDPLKRNRILKNLSLIKTSNRLKCLEDQMLKLVNN